MNTDNVTSKQISVMRKQLRDIDALLICGKNTMMKKAIGALNSGEDEDGNVDENFTPNPVLDKICT